MRRMILSAIGSAALMGFAIPAIAHPEHGDDQHAEQHQQLDEQHQDVHQQLEAIHNDAHEEGLTPYEHERLHRQLDQAHAQADHNIALQHYYQHQNDNLGYNAYNNGYSNSYENGYGYATPQTYYRSNGYARGYGHRAYSRVRHHRHNYYRGY